MSDNFIPLNQSTPVHDKWQNKSQNQRFLSNRYQQNGPRRGGYNRQRWGNNSQGNSSYGSDSSSSFNQDSRNNIDAYLHPSMLEDPWFRLKQKD